MMHADQSPRHHRVLVVVPNPVGGIRTYLLNNCRRLAELGYVFTFLAPQGDAFNELKNDVKCWPDTQFIDVPVRGRRFLLWPSVRRAIIGGQFSLIHSQGLRAGVEVAFASCFRGIPNITTLHDTRHESDITGRFRWLKKRLIGWLAARADVIVAVSHDCANNHLAFFPEWKRSRCRIEVINNGVDVGPLKAGATCDLESLRAQFGWNDEMKILGYFGRLMPEKGFLVLLDTIHELARRGLAERVRLVVTKDPHGYRGEYMREVAQDPLLSTMVRFIEPVAEIGTVLPQVDILVMPSLWEACGLLAMEAMVLGVPVVGSDAIGLREVLYNTPSFSPRAGDVGALADSIVDAIANGSGERAKAFVREASIRFDNRASSQKLHELYDRICH